MAPRLVNYAFGFLFNKKAPVKHNGAFKIRSAFDLKVN